MTPERFRQMEELFHAAAARAPGDRRTFLAEHCAGDRAMQDDVLSLLEQPESPLLTGGAGALLPSISSSAPGHLEGTTLGDYVLGPLVGSGAMGEVYRARDTRLRRDVAVKVLRPAFINDAHRLARLEREGRLLSQVSHSNICTLFDILEFDNAPVLVLELVE